MEQSANLQLPYIMPSQAQKHVTHNEAIRSLDALVHLAVLDRDLSAPPASPADGARYLVAAGATDAWAGKEGRVAAWQDGAWAFSTPKSGWLVWVVDEDRLISFDGVAWIDAAVHSVNPAPMVGVNATADATNRLTVKSPATLFDEETGDHRLKINKAAAGDTASLVFQSGYSGRAEFGLAGDDDWHVKVSADGAAWTEALTVDRATGRVRLPAALPLGDDNQVVARRHVRERLTANRSYYVCTDGSDGNNGLANNSGGAFLTVQKAIDVVAQLDQAGFTVTIQIGAGAYAAGMAMKDFTGPVIVQGDTTTPSNVVISTTSAFPVLHTATGTVTVQGFKLTSSGNGLVYCGGAATTLVLGAMEYGSSAFRQIWIDNGASVQMTAAYTISGGGSDHIYMAGNSTYSFASATVTLTGTPAFGSAFFTAVSGAAATLFSVTYSGSATGARYSATLNAVINTFGGGASYFPGNSAGSAATGGQYA